MIGEVAQVCKSTGLKCSVVQTSEENAEMVMAHLGVEQTSTHNETSMDTEVLLKALSETGKSDYIRHSILNLASDNIWGYC